ncbi:UNKNOWN [Stylonychia lemnae]|uniref:Uncharacterized protein n=1 Tax=Stylonychia lemnae TaxID=5949 RepID=A0A078A1I6_STYLE|nr:UNKNOWN [Stylonychia lemnae]|eukprot:CDW75970.1 UNKNOWN [Stylonychia lemnae]
MQGNQNLTPSQLHLLQSQAHIPQVIKQEVSFLNKSDQENSQQLLDEGDEHMYDDEEDLEEEEEEDYHQLEGDSIHDNHNIISHESNIQSLPFRHPQQYKENSDSPQQNINNNTGSHNQSPQVPIFSGHHAQSTQNQSQQLDLEEIMLKLRQITQSLKPPKLQNVTMQGNAEQEQLDQFWEWLQNTLSLDRFKMMAENIEKLGEGQQMQKARDIELLALKLDIEQAHEINRGKEYNIIKKQ